MASIRDVPQRDVDIEGAGSPIRVLRLGSTLCIPRQLRSTSAKVPLTRQHRKLQQSLRMQRHHRQHLLYLLSEAPYPYKAV